MSTAPALAQTTWCPNDTGSANGTNSISIPRSALSVPHFNITASGGSSGSTAASGTSYYSALQAIKEQMDLQQEQVDSYLDASASLETYDSGGSGSGSGSGDWSGGDISPVPLTGKLCPYGGETKRLSNGKLPVFPGAQGFGVDTPAGRGGKVIKVTNLNDSGSGSLRACVEASGPRVCVFEVSGTISLTSVLTVKNPYLTIAGQTAPSPGIALKGSTFEVSTHDVLVQHIRIRPGDDPNGSPTGSRDGFRVLYRHWDDRATKVYNVVGDHLSVSWGLDENLSFVHGVSDITISNSIVSEGLKDSIHSEGTHSMGALVRENTKNLSLIGNLVAHNMDRNVRAVASTSIVEVNNVKYNTERAQWTQLDHDKGTEGHKLSYVGNVHIPGEGTPDYAWPIKVSNTFSGAKIYHQDNIAEGGILKNASGVSNIEVSSPAVWHESIKPVAGSETEELVFSNAGARPAERDSADNRVINSVINRTGKVIDSTAEVGGWPKLAKNYRVFNVPDNPNGDDDGDGYTNLEEVLHQYAAQVEGCG